MFRWNGVGFHEALVHIKKFKFHYVQMELPYQIYTPDEIPECLNSTMFRWNRMVIYPVLDIKVV